MLPPAVTARTWLEVTFEPIGNDAWSEAYDQPRGTGLCRLKKSFLRYPIGIVASNRGYCSNANLVNGCRVKSRSSTFENIVTATEIPDSSIYAFSVWRLKSV